MVRNLFVTGLSATLMAAFVLLLRAITPAPTVPQMGGSLDPGGLQERGQTPPESMPRYGEGQSRARVDMETQASMTDPTRIRRSVPGQQPMGRGTTLAPSGGGMSMRPGAMTWPPGPMGMCGQMMRMMMGGMQGMGSNQMQTQGMPRTP